MNSKQVQEAKRALRMQVFAEMRAADFNHTPPKPVDAKHAATLAKVKQTIVDLGGKEAIQKANEFGENTEELRGDRGTVEAMLRKINTTGASISEEREQPALMDRFRMPHGNGDTELAAKLRGFGTALVELNLRAALEEHSLVVTQAGLEQMAKELLEGTGEQGAARAKQAGATASIPDTLRTARSCKKTFDAIYGNFYEGDTAILAEWKSISHVPRKGGSDSKDGGGAAPDKAPK